MGEVKKYRARRVHNEKVVADALMEEDKRSVKESADKFKKAEDGEKVEKVEKVGKKKLKMKKIKMSMTKAEEKKLDKDLEIDNNVSTVFIAIVLVLSFVVGISLGYILYKIALTGTI